MITYAGKDGKNSVVFMDKKTGVRLQNNFDSLYQAKCFVEKIKRSKDVVLISYPMFD